MDDQKKTKKELVAELASLRQRIADLERPKSAPVPSETPAGMSEAKYRRLFDTATIGIFQSSREGKVIAANREFARIFGYDSPEDVIGSVQDISSDMYVNPHRRSEIIRLLTENPGLRSFENLYRRKDGSTFTGRLHIWLVHDEDGRPLPIEGFVEDVTELVKKEEELCKQRQYYERLIDSTYDPLHVVDEGLTILLANRRFNEWTEALGITENMVGKRVRDLFAFLPDHVWDEYGEVFRTGKTMVTDNKAEIENVTYHTETTKTPVFRDDGTVGQVITVVRDISVRKENEDNLRRSEKKFATAFLKNSVPAAITTVKEGTFIDVSEAFLTLMGMERSAIVGNTSTGIGFITPEQRMIVLNEFREKGKVQNLELPIATKGGEPRYGLFNSVMISISGEEHLLTMVMDITDRKRLEWELEQSRSNLQHLIAERTKELEDKTRTLEEVNTALKVLLQHREEDKKEWEDRLVMSIKKMVIPFAEKMRGCHLDERQKAYLNIVENHLHDITSSLTKRLHHFNLTSTELEVASLIRDGKATRSIAELMGIAPSSINTHRHSIRKKLGISKKKVNLRSQLRSFD